MAVRTQSPCALVRRTCGAEGGARLPRACVDAMMRLDAHLLQEELCLLALVHASKRLDRHFLQDLCSFCNLALGLANAGKCSR